MVKKRASVLHDAGAFALLCAVTLAAYWPALGGGMVWDDEYHVTSAALQSWHGLWRIWFDVGATQQYYPLLHTAFWIEHRLWGDSVLGYHLVNVLLHAACACLAVLIARRLSLAGAWLAGVLFALHPVCVEGVAWISEQKSTLSALFYLSAMLVYLDYDRTRRLSRYLLASGLFLLALASKTVTATLPAALLVIFWQQRARIEWRRDVRPLAPWIAVGAAAGLFTAWVEKTYIGARGADFALGFPGRVLLAGRALWFYAAKLIFPLNLMFNYPRWRIDPSAWWQYLYPLALLAMAVWFVRLARRERGPLASLLLFGGTLFPALGFFDVYPFRYSYVADHFQYLASLGLIVPIACALTMLARRIAPAARPRLAMAGAGALVLGALTWMQSGAYAGAETLYRQTLARNPDSWLAHNNLGNVLQPQPGELDEAIAEFQAAVLLQPDSELAHNNLASALAESGRAQEAIDQVQTALRLKPDYAKAHNNLGGILAQIPGRLPEAAAEFEAALRSDPENAEAHYNLGNVLAQMPGRLPDAIAQYEAALAISPDYTAAHTNLGGVLMQMPGRLTDAIAQFEEVVRVEPDFAEGHYNLASALAQIPGRESEAIQQYQAAIQLKPDYLAAHTDLGAALAHAGRMSEAVAEFAAAIRIDPNFAEGHYNLASALAQIPGRTPEAVAEFKVALRLKPDFQPAREALQELRGMQ